MHSIKFRRRLADPICPGFRNLITVNRGISWRETIFRVRSNRLCGRARTVLQSAILVLSCLFATVVQSAAPMVMVGDKAPTFEVEAIDGERFILSEHKGKKAVYLVFWATWCSKCAAEIDVLKEIHDVYSKEIELIAINIAVNDSIDKVKKYISKYQLPYTVAFDDSSEITDKFGVVGTPTQIIVDKNGYVQYRGIHAPSKMSELLPKLVGKTAVE